MIQNNASRPDPGTRNTLAAIALCRHTNNEDSAGMRAVLDNPDVDLRDVAASLAGFLVLLMRDHSDDVDAELGQHMAAVIAAADDPPR